MLFFTNDCDLKRKHSRKAAPFGTQRDLSVMVSRLHAPGQRSIEKNLTKVIFRAGIIRVNVCLQGKKKRYWITVAHENEEHLGRENPG